MADTGTKSFLLTLSSVLVPFGEILVGSDPSGHLSLKYITRMYLQKGLPADRNQS